MKKIIHILNGDALKKRFPTSLKGELIVCRECMIDGPVRGESLEQVLANRSRFMSEAYGVTEEEYRIKTIHEMTAITTISPNSQVNLWFEDDLFCQVHFWMICRQLGRQKVTENIFLVRALDLQMGFGRMSDEQLVQAYQRKRRISAEQLRSLSALWRAYQKDHISEMQSIASDLGTSMPFIQTAVDAHIARIPDENFKGRPYESIRQIMHDLDTTEFGSVFAEFSVREAIYGLGDLQVKRIWEKVMAEQF